jgi:hypothetical protein
METKMSTQHILDNLAEAELRLIDPPETEYISDDEPLLLAFDDEYDPIPEDAELQLTIDFRECSACAQYGSGACVALDYQDETCFHRC